MYKLILKIRATLYKIIWPKSSYYLVAKSVEPLSRKFGFDRGTPIDRYWIESFLHKNSFKITGTVLEIVDDTYTKKFGSNVIVSDILDLNMRNKKANLKGNLKYIPNIKDRTYDCIILTQVLGMIDDYESAIRECHRILKDGGTLLITTSCFAPLNSGLQSNFWRFTPAGARYVMSKYFQLVQVNSFGNVLTGQAFWVGLSQEELTQSELDYHDKYYPCLIGVVCQK